MLITSLLRGFITLYVTALLVTGALTVNEEYHSFRDRADTPPIVFDGAGFRYASPGEY